MPEPPGAAGAPPAACKHPTGGTRGTLNARPDYSAQRGCSYPTPFQVRRPADFLTGLYGAFAPRRQSNYRKSPFECGMASLRRAFLLGFVMKISELS